MLRKVSWSSGHDESAGYQVNQSKLNYNKPIVLNSETMFFSLKSLADEKILIILIWLKKQVC